MQGVANARRLPRLAGHETSITQQDCRTIPSSPAYLLHHLSPSSSVSPSFFSLFLSPFRSLPLSRRWRRTTNDGGSFEKRGFQGSRSARCRPSLAVALSLARSIIHTYVMWGKLLEALPAGFSQVALLTLPFRYLHDTRCPSLSDVDFWFCLINSTRHTYNYLCPPQSPNNAGQSLYRNERMRDNQPGVVLGWLLLVFYLPPTEFVSVRPLESTDCNT